MANRDDDEIYELRNSNGTGIWILSYGARLMKWLYRGVNVVCGFDTAEEYRQSKEPFFGATVGRYANRIAGGRFMLNGKQYQLPINNPPNHLHGGVGGFHNRNWHVLTSDQQHVRLQYKAADGEEGYPGAATVTIEYKLTQNDELQIRYEATCDEDTIINLTHHSYFNLNGHGTGDVLNHSLQLQAHSFTPLNADLIPTGEIKDVEGSPFDFRNPKKMGAGLSVANEQLTIAGGYDHNFVLQAEPKAPVARAVGDLSGICLEVFTDQPGLQFYTGNFLKGENRLNSGYYDNRRTAFCLETQHFPDSPNHPHFPSTILRKNQVFATTSTYKLS